MIHMGYHESMGDGFEGLGKEALNIGADTFAFFTRNPRGGQAKPIDVGDCQKLVELMKANNFSRPVAHAPYTMNPCSADEGLREYAYNMMMDDLVRLSNVPGSLYNFHTGSHTGQGAEIGIGFTADMLSKVIKNSVKNDGLLDGGTIILIETMAGKGSEIGRTFEEVKKIIDLTEEKLGTSTEKVLGVCMDSCHIWDGGYDIVNNLDGVISEFDKIVGLSRLKAIHLNDSMNDLASHKDRHAKIGEGKIGLEALRNFARVKAFENLPFILETQNESAGYKREIEMIRG